MSTYETGVVGRINLSGAFECRDAEGRVLKVIQLSGSIPLTDADQLKQVQQHIQEATGGTDNRA